MNSSARWIVIAIGILFVGLTAYLASLGDLTREVPRLFAVYGGLFLLYCASVFVLSRWHRAPRGVLVYVFVVAVLCRAINVAAPPSLSDDIYRYLWEGR